MATREPQTLIDWKTLTTTATASSYSVPSGYRTICGRLTFRNSNSTTVRTVTINMINLSGVSYVFYTKAIAPGKTWTCPDIEGHVLKYDATNPHTVNMAQDTGSDVDVFMSGTEILL